MLFLGMGAAFAQTLPTPTFTLGGDGSMGVSAAPGQTITFTMPDEYYGYMILLCYGFDVDGQLKPSNTEIENWLYYFQSEGQMPKPSASYEVVAYEGNGSTIVITIPEDASGNVDFTARLAGINEDMEAVYSELMEASYNVKGEVVKPAMPTFNPASGEVEPATKVSISSDAPMIWYCINGEDEDLTMAGYMAGKCQQYDEDTKIEIYQGQTIKAVSVVGQQPPFSFSDVATATYTVKGGDVERTDIPKLTLPESPVVVPGSAIFSCTMDVQDYTHKSNLVAFVISGRNIGNIAKLEYQVGETANPEGEWTAYTDDDLQNMKTGSYVSMIPSNEDAKDNKMFKIANGPWTVHYRLTLNPGTSAELTFSAVSASDYGAWSIINAENPLAQTSVSFQNPLPAAPTFEPAAGEVPYSTFVELNCATQGAAIHFTTDGTEPTAESEEYSWFSEIQVTKAMTVKAIAIKDDYRSEVVEAAYTVAPVKAALSIASPMLDDNTVGKNVAVGLTISDPENPASQQWIYTYPMSVYYTIDGATEPSKEAYEAQADKENGAIKMLATQMDEDGYVQTDMAGNAIVLTFSEDTHLKAIGYMTMDEMEIITSVLDKELKVKSFDNPTFSLATYTKVAAGDKLVIKNPASRPEEDEDGEFDDVEPANASTGTLYFSFDGTKPTDAAYNAQEEDWRLDKPYSTYKVFKAEGTDVEITFGQDEQGYYAYVPAITDLFYMPGYDTIRLGADGLFNVDVWCMGAEEVGTHPMTGRPLYFNSGSDFVNAVYTMKDDLPVAAPAFSVAAGEVEKGTKMELACETEGAAIYYTVDGAEPTAESTLYAEAIEINEDMTVKAIAIKGDFKSEVATAAYTVVEPVVEPVAAPTFSVKSGEVEKGTKVEIACETEGAVIYYTVDGTEPTAESTEYKEAIEITGKVTIKAIAIKGELKSEVVEATYELLANEDEELAGVSVYPNPSNGLFNIELPVAATIEVFASNGVLTQRVNAAAGVFTLTLDRSGIYFLRITGEGRTAIKRVIVR